jgi:subtilisin family serine protease
MALPEPPSAVPEVPVEEQFIIGFGETTFVDDAERARYHVDTALSTLLDAMPATLLQKYVATAENKAYFAIAVIRLDGPNQTLANLRDEVESGKRERKHGYAHIEWVEPNAPIALAAPFNDPLLAQQWALAKLGATEPWAVVPPPGPRTIVAIVDSGLRLPGGGLHADLNPALVETVANSQPAGFYPDNVDREGHGTLLAGTIAAVPNNGAGIGSPIAAGWNISLMPVKFFTPPARPTAANAAIAIAHAATRFFNPFTGNLVKVINASWHVPPGGGGLITLLAVTIVAARVLGCLVVFAAGNDGTDNQIYPLFPANLRNHPLLQDRVLTVLATDQYDAKAFFSNYGQNTVDIGAPGIHILSTGRYLVPPPRYAQYSGTSPAAAYVSAGAALIFALNPGWQPADVAQHLTTSADTIQDLMIACIGGRRLNLSRAVYGPLHITAPAPGAVLPNNALTNITWTTEYNNPKFVQVAIAFIEQASGNVHQLGVAGIAAGTFPWTPNTTPPPPLPPLPVTGWIAITPTTGNFLVRSGLITVVA